MKGYGDKVLERIVAWRRCSDPGILDLSSCGTVVEDVKLLVDEDRFAEICSLNLRDNRLGAAAGDLLAAHLDKMPKLTSLNLGNNTLADGAVQVARNLGNLPNLKYLDLRQNRFDQTAMFSALADSLRGVRHLRRLDLRNHFFELADTGNVHAEAYGVSIGRPDLAIFEQFANALDNVPLLEFLELGGNNIGDAGVLALAQKLKEIPLLQHLGLSSNEIADAAVRALAVEAVSLQKLVRLDLRGNSMITDLSPLAVLLPANNGKLHDLNIDGCTGLGLLDSELDEISAPRVFAALKVKTERGAKPWLEVKLAVLGMGGVGKSSLVSRLASRGRRRYAGQSTDDIDLNTRLGIDELGGGDIACRVFDFGGQQELHATHRFFLQSRRTLYVICLNAARPPDDRQNRLSYWLNMVRHYAFTEETRSPVVVVLGHADQWKGARPSITRAMVESVAVQLAMGESVWVVDKYGDPDDGEVIGLEDVKLMLRSAMHSMSYVRNMPIEGGFFDVLRWIEGGEPPRGGDVSKLEGHQRKYFSVELFQRACLSAGAGAERWNIWLQEMRSLGVVHWVGDRPDISRHNRHNVANVIFNPAWVKTPAYRIVRYAPGHGRVTIDAMWQFLNDQRAAAQVNDLMGTLWAQEVFNEADFDKLLQLMTACETLFTWAKGHGDIVSGVIVPDLLPDAQCTTDDLKMSRKLFRLAYNFLPAGVFGRLVGRWEGEIHNNQWHRHEALLSHPLCGDMVARVKEDTHHPALELSFTKGNREAQQRLLHTIEDAVYPLLRWTGKEEVGADLDDESGISPEDIALIVDAVASSSQLKPKKSGDQERLETILIEELRKQNKGGEAVSNAALQRSVEHAVTNLKYNTDGMPFVVTGKDAIASALQRLLEKGLVEKKSGGPGQKGNQWWLKEYAAHADPPT